MAATPASAAAPAPTLFATAAPVNDVTLGAEVEAVEEADFVITIAGEAAAGAAGAAGAAAGAAGAAAGAAGAAAGAAGAAAGAAGAAAGAAGATGAAADLVTTGAAGEAGAVLVTTTDGDVT